MKTILLRPTSDLVEAIETECKNRGITQHAFCMQAIENEIFREPVSEVTVDALIRTRFMKKLIEFSEFLKAGPARPVPKKKRSKG